MAIPIIEELKGHLARMQILIVNLENAENSNIVYEYQWTIEGAVQSSDHLTVRDMEVLMTSIHFEGNYAPIESSKRIPLQ